MLSSNYGLGAGVAGSFGLVGAAGAMVAPVAGKLADKRGTRWVLTAAIALLAISYLVLWAGVASRLPLALHIAALVIGVLVLDVGMQMTQISNQTRIFGLVPSARSRLNTVYMTSFFAGGAIGSALAAMAWNRWQWNGVCILALGLIALTGLCHAFGTHTSQPFNPDSRTDHPVLDSVIEV
jgi:MFS family permease